MSAHAWSYLLRRALFSASVVPGVLLVLRGLRVGSTALLDENRVTLVLFGLSVVLTAFYAISASKRELRASTQKT